MSKFNSQVILDDPDFIGFPLYVITISDKDEYNKISNFINSDGYPEFIEDMEEYDFGFDIYKDFDEKFKEILKTKSESVYEFTEVRLLQLDERSEPRETKYETEFMKNENPSKEDFDKLIDDYVNNVYFGNSLCEDIFQIIKGF
jgi:hypothetical protein